MKCEACQKETPRTHHAQKYCPGCQEKMAKQTRKFYRALRNQKKDDRPILDKIALAGRRRVSRTALVSRLAAEYDILVQSGAEQHLFSEHAAHCRLERCWNMAVRSERAANGDVRVATPQKLG
jgi:hypothetical protein